MLGQFWGSVCFPFSRRSAPLDAFTRLIGLFTNASRSGVERFLKVLKGATFSPIRRTETTKPAEIQWVLYVSFVLEF